MQTCRGSAYLFPQEALLGTDVIKQGIERVKVGKGLKLVIQVVFESRLVLVLAGHAGKQRSMEDHGSRALSLQSSSCSVRFDFISTLARARPRPRRQDVGPFSRPPTHPFSHFAQSAQYSASERCRALQSHPRPFHGRQRPAKPRGSNISRLFSAASR